MKTPKKRTKGLSDEELISKYETNKSIDLKKNLKPALKSNKPK
jgi:hypothetical protein